MEMYLHLSSEWLAALHCTAVIWLPHSLRHLLFTGFLWSPTWTSLSPQSTLIQALAFIADKGAHGKTGVSVCVDRSSIFPVLSCYYHPHGFTAQDLLHCCSTKTDQLICIIGTHRLPSTNFVLQLDLLTGSMKWMGIMLVYKSNTIDAVFQVNWKEKKEKKAVKGALNMLFSLLGSHMGANYNQRF